MARGDGRTPVSEGGDPARCVWHTRTEERHAVRVRDGQVVVEDGPFSETSEPIGGFDLIECADLEEAMAVAAEHPVAKVGTVEVRPLGEE